MYKIAIIGDRESVLGFRGIGFDVADVTEMEQASAALRKFIEQFYAVIFITEQVAAWVDDIVEKHKDAPTPAIIILPNNQGSSGVGMAAIKKSVERAVGADILFNN